MTAATAQVSRTIQAPPDGVWAKLTDAGCMGRLFMGSTVDSDFHVGSPIRFRGEYKGHAFEDRGEILAAEPCRRLSFSHYSTLSGEPDTPDSYHVVTFELEPQGEATEVVLTQTNLTGGVRPSDQAHKAEYEHTWRLVLDALSQAVAH
jgi:uncharacterized protein YndB with AHSA1/START domain